MTTKITVTPPEAAGLSPALIRLALGTTEVPTDDAQLAKLIRTQDRRDANVDLDAFDRALRRAAKLELAWTRKLHKKAKKPWKTWVEANLAGAYETAQRHRYVARLQAELDSHGLPPLSDLAQARVIRRCSSEGTPIDTLRALAMEHGGKLPPARDLATKLAANGSPPPERQGTPRERVTKALEKAISAAEQAPEDHVLEAHLEPLRCALRGIANGQSNPSVPRKGHKDTETLTLLP